MFKNGSGDTLDFNLFLSSDKLNFSFHHNFYSNYEGNSHSFRKNWVATSSSWTIYDLTEFKDAYSSHSPEVGSKYGVDPKVDASYFPASGSPLLGTGFNDENIGRQP